MFYIFKFRLEIFLRLGSTKEARNLADFLTIREN